MVNFLNQYRSQLVHDQGRQCNNWLALATDQAIEETLSGWRNGTGPLRERLASALVRAIEFGSLPPGSRLPPERELGQLLSISRTTVMGAYDRLRNDGRLMSRQGSGTFVPAERLPEGRILEKPMVRLTRNPVFDFLVVPRPTRVDLTEGAPAATAEVRLALRAAVEEDLTNLLRSPGYVTMGLPGLRQAIASYLEEAGLPTTEDQVLVTSGAQQAIALLAALYARSGDAVLVENPTYRGALDVFFAAGARLRSIQMTEVGVVLEDLEQVLRHNTANLIYVTPTFNNPTGAVIPAEARPELARLAARFQVPIVEDSATMDMSLGAAAPPPPIAAFGNNSQVIITIGSLSKLFWGGLRIGWIRAPRQTIDRLAHLKGVADLANPPVTQLAAIRLLQNVAEVRARRRDELVRRLDGVARLLSELLPAWSWRRPAGGVCLWVRLPHGDGEDFARVAIDCGVAVVPGRYFSADDSFRQFLRISFAPEFAQVEAGIHYLARAWQRYASGAPAVVTMHRSIV
jgi:DNA-binding transcriptional MocR family regulator